VILIVGSVSKVLSRGLRLNVEAPFQARSICTSVSLVIVITLMGFQEDTLLQLHHLPIPILLLLLLLVITNT